MIDDNSQVTFTIKNPQDQYVNHVHETFTRLTEVNVIDVYQEHAL